MNTLQRCLPRTVSLLDGRHAAAVVFRYCSSSSSGGGGGGGDSKGGPVVILEKRKNEELKSAVGHSPNTNGNGAASKDGLREELQLLDTVRLKRIGCRCHWLCTMHTIVPLSSNNTLCVYFFVIMLYVYLICEGVHATRAGRRIQMCQRLLPLGRGALFICS